MTMKSDAKQNLKKNWLVFGKWNEEVSKFLPEHSKVSKLVLWMDPLVQRRKRMNL